MQCEIWEVGESNDVGLGGGGFCVSKCPQIVESSGENCFMRNYYFQICFYLKQGGRGGNTLSVFKVIELR